MNALKSLARRDSFRLAAGGILGGLAAYALARGYPIVTWIALPLAVFVGALSCFVCERPVEAAVKAAITGALLLLVSLHLLPRLMKNYPSSSPPTPPPMVQTLQMLPKLAKKPAGWQIAFVASSLGFFSGMAVGSLLGGACRLAFDP